MDLFVIVFLIIVIIGIKPVRNNENYLGRETTTAIKGIFAIIILFNHSRQYISTPPEYAASSYTMLYNSINDIFGQLMVVMFLTYSGYGIMESYKKKQHSYLTGFFKKRVLKTLVHFDIAVCAFLILALIFDRNITTKQVVLSFVGWKDLGNSNWFIFDIIVLYLLSYIGLLVTERFKLNIKHVLWIITISSICFFCFMYKAKHGSYWWYDTILSFPAGMIWSVYNKELEQKLINQRNYITITVSTGIMLWLTYYIGINFKALFLYLNAPIFAIFVILITMRMKIGNTTLHWLGINAFSIYILQRIPMIIATEYGFNLNPPVFFSIILPCTLLIAVAFTKFNSKIDKVLFK